MRSCVTHFKISSTSPYNVKIGEDAQKIETYRTLYVYCPEGRRQDPSLVWSFVLYKA